MQSKQSPKKLLLIGLEGATLSILKSLIKQNKLPFFSRLYSLGIHTTLKANFPINRANSWASFFTGKNSGKHGLFDFLDYESDPVSPKIKTGDAITTRLLWDFLNQTDLKTILFNIPIMKAPEPVNGVMVSGFLTPEGDKIAYPDFINEKIQKENLQREIGQPANKNDQNYLNSAIAIFKKQMAIFRQLIIDREWDLALFTSNLLDRIQPLYWLEQDKIEKAYLEIDSMLNDLEHSLPPDIHIIVFSNFSYTPVNKKFFVNEWLWEKGLQQRKIATSKNFISDIDEYFSVHSNGNGRTLPNLLAKTGITKNNIRSLFPDKMNDILDKAVPQSIKRIFHTEYLNINWNNSRAFFFSPNIQGITLNVKGREPFGTVEPGREYEQLRDQIISDLFHLKDPYTFEHVFEDILKKEDVFSGQYLDKAPDIILVPRKSSYFLHPQKRSSRLFIGSANDDNPVHAQRKEDGIFFMKFPDYAVAGPIPSINLTDLLPTILAFFDMNVQDEFDGVVRKELIRGSENVLQTGFRPDFISVPSNATMFKTKTFTEVINSNNFS